MKNKLCLVCLVPANDAALSSLRENGGEKAKLFEKLFGIELNDSLDALICEKCTAQVDKVHAFIDNARLLDETHFKASRLLGDCGSDDNKLPVCRCCLSTTRLVGITEEEPDLVSLLLKITGIDVRDIKEKVLICSKCKKTLKRVDTLDFTINENQKLHFSKNVAKKVSTKKIPIEMTAKLKPAPGAGSFSCSLCEKDFATALKLRRHMGNIHNRKKKFTCNFCIYSTAIFGNLVEHFVKHLKPLKETVKKKGQKTYGKYEDSEVSLTCSFCKEDSASTRDLKNHLMEHLANLEFRCDHCGFGCFKKTNMVDHITCKHVIKSHRDMYDLNRQHQCTFEGCFKRFKTASLLKQHFSLTHSGIRHTCFWCQKSYCRKTYLNKHQKSCVGIVTPNIMSSQSFEGKQAKIT